MVKKKEKSEQKKLPMSVIYALAAYWGKDYRTIQRWVKVSSPMLEHPKSVEIIKSFSKK